MGRNLAIAAATLALSGGLAGFALVHSRDARDRADRMERRLSELEARLAPAGNTTTAAPPPARPDAAPPSPATPDAPLSAQTDSSSPSAPKLPPSAMPGRPWAALPQEERAAVLELVKEAQKEIHEQEVWGWTAGIQTSFVKSMREKLRLTTAQEERVSAVLKLYLPELNKVWHLEEGTPEERAAKSKELWDRVDGEIAPALTGEQALAYAEWRKEQAERAKKHAESGGR